MARRRRKLGFVGRRLRVTREGKYFVGITIGVGLAAVNTGNNLLYLILGWQLSLIIGSGILSNATLRALRVARRVPHEIYAGRPFLMEIELENRKTRLASYAVEVEDAVAERRLDKRCFFLKIEPTRSQRATYRHTFMRRGVYHFSGFRLSTRFPFSLFEKARGRACSDEVLVFPRVQEVPIPAPVARNLGETRSRNLGRHGEFFALREYRDGDDRRGIHWRSTARTGRLLVRELQEEAQRRATVVIDNSAEDPDAADEIAAVEAAIDLAASLASAYLKRGYQVQLIGRDVLVPHGAGPSHLRRVLRALALADIVTPDVEFSARVDPNAESVLASAPGARTGERPAVGHVVEAGA